MSGWAAAEEYAFAWDCDAYVVTAELQGAQDFKIADAGWTPSASFAAPRDSEGDGGAIPVARADQGGSDNLRHRFDGWSTIRLRPGDVAPVLTVTRAEPRPEPLSDARLRSLRHDSRDLRHRAPFGAVAEETEIAFGLDGAPADARITL